MNEGTLGSFKKYELRTKLPCSAGHAVYEAWDPEILRRVAIKTLPLVPDGEAQDQLLRFQREAQAAGRLNHPNIASVYEFGKTNDLAYIIMEFVPGRSLKKILREGERFSVEEIVTIIENVLAALSYSHARGVIHRDIKPANVIIPQGGPAKLVDFGIAKVENSSLTQVGDFMGTPAYSSPEQLVGNEVDWRTDLYSVGVLLYELLTGKPPFEGSLGTITHKALHTVPPSPSSVSPLANDALDRVVKQAMAKSPNDRFSDAAAFAQALTKAVATAEETQVANARTAISAKVRAVLPTAAAAWASLPLPRWLTPWRVRIASAGFLILAGGGAWSVSHHHVERVDKPTLESSVSVTETPAERSDKTSLERALPASSESASQASVSKPQRGEAEQGAPSQQGALSAPGLAVPAPYEAANPHGPDPQAQLQKVESQRDAAAVPASEPSPRESETDCRHRWKAWR